MPGQWGWSERTTLFCQVLILLFFYAFVFGIIGWISRLIWLSWRLRDVFSASIGISLIGMPLFVFLLAVYTYVFWGILRNRGQKEEGGKE
jgi:hypothetical protein